MHYGVNNTTIRLVIKMYNIKEKERRGREKELPDS